jgi:hypothetical protein
MSANSSSLRPAWYKGSGGQGGRGFQPPPTVTSERGDKDRSSSFGSQERRDANKFAVLDDDDDDVIPASSSTTSTGSATSANNNGSKQPDGGAGGANSRSEAFRSSFNNRSAATGTGTGTKPAASGRSLSDLASRVPADLPAGGAPPGTVPGAAGAAPAAAVTGSRRSAAPEGGSRSSGAPAVSGGGGRFSGLPGRATDNAGSSNSSVDRAAEAKVIRFTREKLLSMRSAPPADEEGPPPLLIHMDGAVILSKTPQDPGTFFLVLDCVVFDLIVDCSLLRIYFFTNICNPKILFLSLSSLL